MNNFYLEKAKNEKAELFKDTVFAKNEKKIFETGDKITLDFGNHYVGYFSFNMDCHDIYIDAPVELEIKFFENSRELSDDYNTYHGTLCKSWLQRENIFIDFPGKVKLPRRYACRYVTIEVVNTPRATLLYDFEFESVTTADMSKLVKPCLSNSKLEKIDKIAVNTLKNCMQEVFEDGPKRDRRLWLGDLRLEALTGYYTLRNDSLVRKCLYLFAAGDVNKYGFLPSFIYEKPKFVRGEWDLLDYSLLFVVSVCDYFEHTGDKIFAKELEELCCKQLDSAEKLLDNDGIISCPDGMSPFIDWCEGLEKTIALHGVYLYATEKFVVLLNALANNEEKKKKAEIYENRLVLGRKAAVNMLYNDSLGIFMCGKDNFQKSVHSQAWMILGGAVQGREAEKALEISLYSDEFLKPKTPYMQHYVCEAMVKLGLIDKAKQFIESFWGAMADEGADTFYEIFSPDEPELSPYGDRMINSMCHAWSCSPSYFIRKYRM